jgi:adenosylmethionine-8-amino-7-oxononanoate aminotransferase
MLTYADVTGMGRVYYSSSGSEANEKAYKMVCRLNRALIEALVEPS